MSNDPFVNTPPTKPGFYMVRLNDGYETIAQVCAGIPETDLYFLIPGSSCNQNMDTAAQWDPTPIPGPGEVAKMVEEAYKEGWNECAEPDGYCDGQEAWENSVARAALEGR